MHQGREQITSRGRNSDAPVRRFRPHSLRGHRCRHGGDLALAPGDLGEFGRDERRLFHHDRVDRFEEPAMVHLGVLPERDQRGSTEGFPQPGSEVQTTLHALELLHRQQDQVELAVRYGVGVLVGVPAHDVGVLRSHRGAGARRRERLKLGFEGGRDEHARSRHASPSSKSDKKGAGSPSGTGAVSARDLAPSPCEASRCHASAIHVNGSINAGRSRFSPSKFILSDVVITHPPDSTRGHSRLSAGMDRGPFIDYHRLRLGS